MAQSLLQQEEHVLGNHIGSQVGADLRPNTMLSLKLECSHQSDRPVQHCGVYVRRVVDFAAFRRFFMLLPRTEMALEFWWVAHVCSKSVGPSALREEEKKEKKKKKKEEEKKEKKKRRSELEKKGRRGRKEKGRQEEKRREEERKRPHWPAPGVS